MGGGPAEGGGGDGTADRSDGAEAARADRGFLLVLAAVVAAEATVLVALLR